MGGAIRRRLIGSQAETGLHLPSCFPIGGAGSQRLLASDWPKGLFSGAKLVSDLPSLARGEGKCGFLCPALFPRRPLMELDLEWPSESHEHPQRAGAGEGLGAWGGR